MPEFEVVGDRGADHFALALRLAQHGLGGNPVVREQQGRALGDERLEFVVDLAVLDPEGGLGHGEMVIGEPQQARSVEHIERDGVEQNVGIGEARGDVAVDPAGKVGDAKARGVPRRSELDR